MIYYLGDGFLFVFWVKVHEEVLGLEEFGELYDLSSGYLGCYCLRKFLSTFL